MDPFVLEAPMTAMLLGSNSLSRLRVVMTLVPSFVVALPRASGPGLGGDLAQHDRKSGAGLPAYSTPRRLPVHPRGRWTRRRTGFAGTYRRYRRFRARRHGDRPEACTPPGGVAVSEPLYAQRYRLVEALPPGWASAVHRAEDAAGRPVRITVVRPADPDAFMRRMGVVAAHVLGDHEDVGAVLPDVEHGEQVEMAGRRDDAHAAHERVGIGGPHHCDAHGAPGSVLGPMDRRRPAGRQSLHKPVALCVQGLAHCDTSRWGTRLRSVSVPASPKTPVPSVCAGEAGSPSRPPPARMNRKPPRRTLRRGSRAGLLIVVGEITADAPP